MLINIYICCEFVENGIVTEYVKSCIYRIFTDIIKADNIIAFNELEELEKYCNKYGISEQDRVNSSSISLETAVSVMAEQPRKLRYDLIDVLGAIVNSDNDCSREESILLNTLSDCIGKEKEKLPGRIVSIPSSGVMIKDAQLVYLTDRNNHIADRVLDNDDDFDELSNLATMAGFELIYIPRIAAHYKSYKNHPNLRLFTSLLSPNLKPSEIDIILDVICNMSTPYFYRQVLSERLSMKLELDSPVWMMKVSDNMVGENEYSNFLFVRINLQDIKHQLKKLLRNITQIQSPFTIQVNKRRDKASDFQYDGFYRTLLDMMLHNKIERWNLCFRTMRNEPFRYVDKDGKSHRAIVTIQKGSEEYPLQMASREAAYYLLLICASIESTGVDFNNATPNDHRIIQKRYENIYNRLSARANIPDICLATNRNPIKKHILDAVEASLPLTEKNLYKPNMRNHIIAVPIEPGRVWLMADDNKIALKDSKLYDEYCRVARDV